MGAVHYDFDEIATKTGRRGTKTQETYGLQPSKSIQ
jgi:hypothetical protein